MECLFCGKTSINESHLYFDTEYFGQMAAYKCKNRKKEGKSLKRVCITVYDFC